MEINDKHKDILSYILAFTAGFSDTVTFTAANKLFSAHVTGNFIVFAYELVKGIDLESWFRLLTFPLFVISVSFTSIALKKIKNAYYLLFIEGLILFVAGVISFLLQQDNIVADWQLTLTAFLIVFAMGIQNAFNKIYAKATHAPTTVMTGNVTQATIDFTSYWSRYWSNQGQYDESKKVTQTKFKIQLMVIVIFFIGCLSGSFLGSIKGMQVILLLGVFFMVYFGRLLFEKKHQLTY